MKGGLVLWLVIVICLLVQCVIGLNEIIGKLDLLNQRILNVEYKVIDVIEGSLR